jgi:DNA-binding LytR/AlgR family response regulator
MKVSINEIGENQEEEIIIRCHEVNDDIIKILDKLKTNNDVLIGYDGDNIHRIKYNDVYYFEAVDNKVFIYCKDKIFESKQKLYEIEKLCRGKRFFRAYKSTIINVVKISYIKPSVSGRFEAVFDIGENIIVSRQYVPVLKDMLEL